MSARTKAGLLLACLIAAAGCLGQRTYTYEQVVAEYTPPSSPAAAAPAPSPVKEAPRGPLTLQAALDTALADSPRVEVALARIQEAQAMSDLAQSAFLPRLGLYGEALKADAPSTYLFKAIDQGKLKNGTDFNDPGEIENLEYGLKMGWSLYRGGRDLLALQMARQGVDISRLGHREVTNALAASVIQTFYDCLAAAEMVDIADQSIRTVTEQHRIMDLRFREGGVLKSDVLSLEVRLAQAREDKVRAENAQRLALSALANLLGLDADAELAPVNGERAPVPTPPDYAEGLALALSRRPELAAARARVVQARLGLDQAQAAYLPTLEGRGRLYQDTDDLDPQRENWMVGLFLDWEAFSGLERPARAAQARAALRQVLAADRQATLGVQLDVKSAYLNLRAAQARHEVSQASVAQANESLQLVQRQYEGGSASVTRYLDAELALASARQRASAARFDTQKARAEIARALGLLAPAKEVQP